MCAAVAPSSKSGACRHRSNLDPSVGRAAARGGVGRERDGRPVASRHHLLVGHALDHQVVSHRLGLQRRDPQVARPAVPLLSVCAPISTRPSGWPEDLGDRVERHIRRRLEPRGPRREGDTRNDARRPTRALWPAAQRPAGCPAGSGRGLLPAFGPRRRPGWPRRGRGRRRSDGLGRWAGGAAGAGRPGAWPGTQPLASPWRRSASGGSGRGRRARRRRPRRPGSRARPPWRRAGVSEQRSRPSGI